MLAHDNQTSDILAEPHLYTIIKVARDGDLHEHIGKYTYFDLVDHDKVHSFRIQNQTPFAQFKEEVAKELGIPVQHQRFWLWAKRRNHTYRPDRPLTPQEESQSVGHLRKIPNKPNNAELKLFLEVEVGQDLQPIPPPEKTKEEILLFFKLYDPSREELRYVGRLFVKGTGKPIEILSKLNELAGFGREEELELFEEIKFEPNVMCEHIDKKLTFRGSQLEDGDIICFQKALRVESTETHRYPDVPSFLEYLRIRQVVRFRSLEKPKEDKFLLELSKLNNYDDVVERVAGHLNLVDPSKIRLTSHNCNSQQPKPQPIKYRGVEHLSDMLAHDNQISDILYYEVMDIPLPELQSLKTLKVDFHHATKDEVVIHTIRLPKQSTVRDVINDLKKKVELSHKGAELRLVEVFYHKIYKIFPLDQKIENINDQHWTLRAEEIPEEEKDLDPQDRLIHVYHFMKDTTQNQQVQNFGEPFLLVIGVGETLADVKVRIQKKLQVPDEEFSKWRFAFLSLGRPTYLQDSDIVSSYFQRRGVYGAWEHYLGLEHSDNPCKRRKRVYVANQVVRFRSLEKPKEDKFSLELSKLSYYDNVVERVAGHLNLDDPSKLRLTSHNCNSRQPNPQPIKYRGVEHLSDMLVHDNQTSDILYYEVLDIPLAEAHLYTIIKVARDGDLHEQIGKYIYFDLVNHDRVRSFRIQNQTPFAQFKEKVAKELGIPAQHQRFWLWAKRQNHTYRPDRPLTPQEESQSVGHLRKIPNKPNNDKLKLFLEVDVGQGLRPIPRPEKTKEEILLFFKLYDPSREELRYVGRLFVKVTGKPIEILSKLNELAGFGREEELELFEEIKFEPNVMCEHIDKKLTFRGSQLEDGDIICFQKAIRVESTKRCRYPDVPSFLEYLHSLQIVRFRSLERPKEDKFPLGLSKPNNYNDVVERVAGHLNLDDPSKIRLYFHNCHTQQPVPQPFKYHGVGDLSDMLAPYYQTSDILYYKVLDSPLPELKTLRVPFHHATKDEVVIHTIRLPNQSTVGDVINDLKTKVELSHKDAELRLVEVYYIMISKIFPLNKKIVDINDKYLRAEEIPEEEKDLDSQDHLIHVYHFTKWTGSDLVQSFGKPFFFVIHEGETLADVRVRIQKKLQVPDEEFSKWRFAFLSSFRPTYLRDSDIVSSYFQVYGTCKQTLGLEHSNNTPKRLYAANQQEKIQTHASQSIPVVSSDQGDVPQDADMAIGSDVLGSSFPHKKRSRSLLGEKASGEKRARTSISISSTEQEKVNRIIKEHKQLIQYTTAQHEFLVEQTRDMNEMKILLQQLQGLVPGLNVPQHLLSTVRTPPSPPVIFDDATTSQPLESVHEGDEGIGNLD